MKICIIGLGSMGVRHLRNLTDLLSKRGEPFRIDALRSSARPLDGNVKSMLSREYPSVEILPSDYDIAFVCNPTNLHYDTLRTMRGKARHFFIEKPVFDRADMNPAALELNSDSVCYVAAPLRYTRVIRELKTIVEQTDVYAVRAICSTYLPGWRPGVDYRNSYSAHKDRGGGVSIDLIHEWDYLTYLFGFPKRVTNYRGRYSNLQLECEDCSLYLGQYPDKLISLHLDYFGRAERREVELYTPFDTIVGDLRKQEIRWLRSGQSLSLKEERDDYQKRELLHFFAMIENRVENDNSISHALNVLQIADCSQYPA